MSDAARTILDALRAEPVITPRLRALARPHRREHALAHALWRTGDPHARMIASMVADPARADEAMLERWVRDLDSWGICDCCAFELFRHLPDAHDRAEAWCGRPEEFVKRAGFATVAGLAISDKRAPDAGFVRFLRIIEREAADERHFVKKAVNWALRQIGKRNAALNDKAARAARRIAKQDSRAARWVGADALKELESEAVQRRLREGAGRRARRGPP